jgi:hypothetical protein
VATRAKSKTRSKTRSTSARNSKSRDSAGVHVKPDLRDPHVARITVEINWDELIARVARKMGRGIKARQARRARRAHRAPAS